MSKKNDPFIYIIKPKIGSTRLILKRTEWVKSFIAANYLPGNIYKNEKYSKRDQASGSKFLWHLSPQYLEKAYNNNNY